MVYFMAIKSILGPLGIFCGHWVYFSVIWHILSPFGMLNQDVIIGSDHYGCFGSMGVST
jgi:hypothetical protein